MDGTTANEEEERLKAKEDRQKRRKDQRKFLGNLVGCGREGKIEGQGGPAKDKRRSEKVFGRLSGLWARVW